MPPASAKVGFAAIQEMARLQERALMGEDEDDNNAGSSNGHGIHAAAAAEEDEDLSFLRFDPEANCLKLESYEFRPPSEAKRLFSEALATPEPQAGSSSKVSSSSSKVPGRFPLEVGPSPMGSPAVGLRRFGSFRCVHAYLARGQSDQIKVSVHVATKRKSGHSASGVVVMHPLSPGLWPFGICTYT